MYTLIRNALFMLSAETAHELAMDSMAAAARLKLTKLISKPKQQKAVTVFGINFPNAVGLAAGLDKNGDAIDTLGALGFGFVELGTVTPKPQPGNPMPRMFRIEEKDAIINRMGFNNKGVDYLVERVKHASYDGVIGINIGKNKDTPEEEAVNDYLHCLDKVYEIADYIVVNLSSPNTPGLRNLQFGENLIELIKALKARQVTLNEQYAHTPILIKIAPDLTDDEITELAQTFNEQAVEGIVTTNTTVNRDAVEGLPNAKEAGGLSGAPVKEPSNRVLKAFREQLNDDIPIIGVGGILHEHDAEEKMQLGADLVQIYSGFIYEGPSLIRRTIQRLANT